MKDPFEAAFEDQDSPPESPIPPPLPPPETETAAAAADGDEDNEIDDRQQPIATAKRQAAADCGGGEGGRAKDEDEDDEDENMADVEFGKFSAAAGDPDKMAKMQAILSQFTEEQMSRYESFRRSGFQKANMKREKSYQNMRTPRLGRLRPLDEIESTQSISRRQYTTSCRQKVMSVDHKGLVNTVGAIGKHYWEPKDFCTHDNCGIRYSQNVCWRAYRDRIVMAERNDSGPIRPCHIREAYRRLKLEGKIPKRSVPRLFR